MSRSLAAVQALSGHPVLVLFVGALILGLAVIVRRIYFHPLSKYPGPFLGKFSAYYTFVSTFQEHRTELQYEMLQKYGSPFRFATDQLVFSDAQSIADIYGQSSNPCLKDPAVYNPFTVTGARNVFNVVDRSEHSRMRRLLTHQFSARSLLEREKMLAAKIETYIETSYRGREGQVIDVYRKNHHLYLDIISELGLGQSLDCLRGNNMAAAAAVEAFVVVVPAAAFFPMSRYLPLKTICEGLAGVERLATQCQQSVQDALRRLKEKPESNGTGERSFLDNLSTAKDPETGTMFSTNDLVEQAILFLVAGSSTTAISTTYFLYECGRRPEVRRRLAEEIRTAFPDPNIFPTYEEASKLEYLNNCINEVFRLRGPLTVDAPRISPGRMIGGSYVPPNIVVTNNPYATARDPSVYRDPLRFDPDRWEKSSVTPEMRLMNRPFSTGPRNCLGRHLAEITLFLTLSRIYQLYDVVPDPSMTEDKMRLREQGSYTVWGSKFLVTATKAGSKE